MQTLAHKIGFRSSLLIIIPGLILIAANIGIGFSGQWRVWEGMEAYAAWYTSVRIKCFTIAFIASFLMVVLFLGIVTALQSLAPDEKKVPGTPGVSLTAICITLVSITHYTQLSIVRNSIQSLFSILYPASDGYRWDRLLHCSMGFGHHRQVLFDQHFFARRNFGWLRTRQSFQCNALVVWVKAVAN